LSTKRLLLVFSGMVLAMIFLSAIFSYMIAYGVGLNSCDTLVITPPLLPLMNLTYGYVGSVSLGRGEYVISVAPKTEVSILIIYVNGSGSPNYIRLNKLSSERSIAIKDATSITIYLAALMPKGTKLASVATIKVCRRVP